MMPTLRSTPSAPLTVLTSPFASLSTSTILSRVMVTVSGTALRPFSPGRIVRVTFVFSGPRIRRTALVSGMSITSTGSPFS